MKKNPAEYFPVHNFILQTKKRRFLMQRKYRKTYIKTQDAVALGRNCYALKWFVFDDNYNSSKK